jgi:uncharacterized protein YjiS (DUF1127 family)
MLGITAAGLLSMCERTQRRAMFARSATRLLLELVHYIGGSPLSRQRQLDSLRGLDDHLLRDIGISRRAPPSGRPCDNGVEAWSLHGDDGISRDV